MALVEKVVSIWFPAMVYADGRNNRKDLDKRLHAQMQKENGGKVAYFNGQWYDAEKFIYDAVDEIGDVPYLNEEEHSEICRKYADRFIKEVLAGRVKPKSLSMMKKKATF